ncbi:hypothetical protein S40293_02462 [Stachybotrys chartarum IBT 40293]|nr:hypothetical protein S40293_02462 [Stachybotrys chartarum IBT 40293]
MTNQGEGGSLQDLVEAFTPLLDEPLIVAIASDHDLQKAAEYQAAYDVLQDLAKCAVVEEAAGFNPSGMSTHVDDANIDADEAINDDHSADNTTVSHRTSHTHVTSTSSASSDPMLPRLTSFNNDSEDSKIVQLQSLFGELKEYDIRHALKKANGDFQAALDYLLHVQYLQSTGQLTKGVDGFFQPDEAPRGKKKGKRGSKGKQSSNEERDTLIRNVDMQDYSKQSKHQDDIAFITDRIDVSFNEVSEIYYRKKCSPGATVVEVLDRYIALGIHTQDEASQKYAAELSQKYRLVPERYMATLVQVAGSIAQFSDDIAALLNKHFAKNPWTERLDLTHRLTPLPRDDIEGSADGTVNKKTLGSPLSSPVSSPRFADFGQALQMSHQYNTAKRDATASASQLRKKGASNSLYRQAAGYYSERARELGRHAQQATSSAADLLVEQQSRLGSVDLHGVYVHDGVRIARQKTTDWWQGLGEFRAAKARSQPFTVITGLGRHSAGGVSQLRQAVAAALLQDGWRMQIETGRFVITGRR